VSALAGELRLDAVPRTRATEVTRRPRDPWLIFLLIFAAELAFGMWMNSRGINANDAASRASLALTALYGSDPHLSAIGFNWMPLPTFLELGTTAFFPYWGGIVTSGFAYVVITAVAAGGSAALLLWTCSRLGLPRWVGWAFALAVATNPMLFLYGSNGMSEGLGAPFFIGAVCLLTLYWHTGQRLYVGGAGVALAGAFLCVYEAVPYGIALFAALLAGIFWRSESRGPMRQGRFRAIEGLGLALLLPSVFVGVLWLAINAAVMKDPLAFTHGPYASFVQNKRLGAIVVGGPYAEKGHLIGTIHFTAELTWPFLVPIAALLVVRALDRRLLRVNSLALVLLALSVPAWMIAPLIYRGLSAGFLRYVMFPLFVAAGWGLFEIATSASRRRAAAVILAGWIVGAGAAIWVMSSPRLGPESEHVVLQSIRTGKDAEQLNFQNSILLGRPYARFLERGPFAEGAIVAADQERAFAIASNLPLGDLHRLMLTPDRRFERAILSPREYGVKYLLVPTPAVFPEDAINRARPQLWSGHTPGFRLVTDFPRHPSKEQWRLYEVLPARLERSAR
jgi:hypothetical protein